METANYTTEDFRFTTKGDVLYAIGLKWPIKEEIVIHSLEQTLGTRPVQSIALLGSDAKLQFEQRSDGLHVHLPTQSSAKYAYVLRMTF